MTEATIRNRTLIVPSTICNGPVMFSSRVRLVALVSRPPLGDDRVIIGVPDRPRTGGWPARGSGVRATAHPIPDDNGRRPNLLTGNLRPGSSAVSPAAYRPWVRAAGHLSLVLVT